jgi:MarR family transcriptional regulator, transcriptional regulator for hemolysin
VEAALEAGKARTAEQHSTPEAGECPQCLGSNLGWLLSQASYTLATELGAALEPLGISPRSYCVLATAMGGEHTQTELTRLVGMDKTTMVVTLDALEEAGLAERRPSASDRRTRVIAVTKQGEKTVAKARELIEAVQADVLAALPAAERKRFVTSLEGLVSDRLAEPVECGSAPRRREPGR